MRRSRGQFPEAARIDVILNLNCEGILGLNVPFERFVAKNQKLDKVTISIL